MCEKCADNRSALESHSPKTIQENIMDRLDELERAMERRNSDRNGYFVARPFHAETDDDATT